MAATCRNCGTELDDTMTACPNCGTAALGEPGKSSGAEAPPGESSQAGPGGAGQTADGGEPATPPQSAEQSPPWASPQPAAPPALTSEQRNWAMFAHLSALATFVGIPWILGPLLIWLLKRNDSPFIDHHGKEAVNFNISAFIYFVVAGVLTVVGGVVTLGFGLILLIPLLIAIGVGWAVLVVIAGIKASQGEPYRYPLTIRLVS